MILELPIREPAIELDDGRRITVIRCGTLKELRDRQRLEVERRRHPRLVRFVPRSGLHRLPHARALLFQIGVTAQAAASSMRRP